MSTATTKKIPPPGIIVERIEFMVDGGRVANKDGIPEVDLVWPTDDRARATVTVPPGVLSMLPIGSRVVLQLEALPEKKPTQKPKRRGCKR
jgi:hypothetical protein